MDAKKRHKWLIWLISSLRNSLLSLLPPLTIFRASLLAHMVKNLPAMWETGVWSLVWEDPLERGMAIYSSTLTWRIARTEELQSCGCRVRHDWVTNTHTHTSFSICIWESREFAYTWQWLLSHFPIQGSLIIPVPFKRWHIGKYLARSLQHSCWVSFLFPS